jgi:phosphatidylglycerophosphate synthase
MVEPIGELKKICLLNKYDELHRQPWASKHINRHISIRFTRLCLILGLSANQATLTSLLLGITAGIFFTRPQALYWLIGLLFLHLSLIFDCVDGEIARYRKQSSSEGKYFDIIVMYFLYPYILACMSFGLYFIIQGPEVFIAGFLAVIGMSLVFVHKPLAQSILYEKKLPYAAPEATAGKNYGIIHHAYELAKAILIIPSLKFVPQFLLVTILDCFIEPFQIASFTLNVRFLYLVIFASGTIASVIVRYYAVRRFGINVSVGVS